jgi:hypothetical protein
MTECATCGQLTPDDRDFCSNCGAYLRWEEPEPDEQPTAVLSEEAVTTVMAVEPAPLVVTTTGDPVRVSLMRPEDPGAGAEPPTVRVQAGGTARLIGMVFNQSGIVDRYELRVVGFDPAWCTVAPMSVDLVPFGAAEGGPEARVEVHLHPPRAPEAEARAWDVALVARSVTHGTEAAGRGTLVIEPFEQLDMRVRPRLVRDRRSARLLVPVRNLGNARAHVRFDGEDDEGVVRFGFVPPSLELGAGQEGYTELTLTADPLRSTAVHRQLTIAAESGRERVERQATFVQEPVVKRSHRFAWRVALTLLAALLLVAGAFAAWNGDGDKGLCTSSGEGCLSWNHYLSQAGIANPDPLEVNTAKGLVAAVTSLGILALVLAALVLLGARGGGLMWFAGCLAVLLAIVMFVTLGTSGIGVWLVLLGGGAAIAAGALARPATSREGG